MFEWMADPAAWASFATLTLMEIILGIDNIVFITILCGDLPEQRQPFARRLGIGAALVSRLLLLFAIGWVMTLTEPLLVVPLVEATVSGKDLILVGGGMFLLWKGTQEIYENIEQPEEVAMLGSEDVEEPDGMGVATTPKKVAKRYGSILAQILLLDLVFSLDSVITAIGMSEHISVMATAMVIAVIVMMVFAGPIGDFIHETPSVRILALAFLILIGVTLVMEGTGAHVSKGYIYSAMGFSLFVELINLRRKRNLDRPEAQANAS